LARLGLRRHSLGLSKGFQKCAFRNSIWLSSLSKSRSFVSFEEVTKSWNQIDFKTRDLTIIKPFILMMKNVFLPFQAKDIYSKSSGKQQVLPLESIYRKTLPDWNK
jgi:hypothetical protein